MTTKNDETNDENNSEESPPDLPAMSKEVETWSSYFKVPLAVQLREALVTVEATQEMVKKDDGVYAVSIATNGMGWPQLALKRDDKGAVAKNEHGHTAPDIAAVVFGSMDRSECGQRLLLSRPTPMGAKAVVSIDPKSIAYVTTLPELPPPLRIQEGGRIVTP